MWSGVWPPSNHAGIEAPARDFWPLVPRPAVLPLPAAMPRPTRLRLASIRPRAEVVDLHAFFSWVSASRDVSGDLLDLDEEADLADHAADGVVVGKLDRAADPVQAERADRAAVAGDVADRALGLGDAQLTGHRRPPSCRGRGLAGTAGCAA
jgi:hypothetical protein